MDWDLFLYGYIFLHLLLNGKSYIFIYCIWETMFAYIKMQLRTAKIFIKKIAQTFIIVDSWMCNARPLKYPYAPLNITDKYWEWRLPFTDMRIILPDNISAIMFFLSAIYDYMPDSEMKHSWANWSNGFAKSSEFVFDCH